jgi:ABC-type glycerol-3-phosphate transport system substrate-binding protein
MKKLSTLLLAVLFVIGMVPVFAGAGKEDTGTSQGPKKITWMSWGHARPQEIRNEALQSIGLSDRYVIESVVGGTGVSEVIEKIRLAFASKTNLPDIFQTSSMYFPEMAASGMLADVSTVYTKYNNQLLDGMKELCSYNGKQYAFPYCENTLIWIYRTDIFAKAGIDPAGIKNTDDFIAAGKKLLSAVPNAHIHSGNVGNFVGIFNWLAPGAAITSLIDSSGNYVFNKDPKVNKLLQDIKKILDSGISYNVSDWTPDWEQGFANDRIVSYLTCNWFKDAAFLPKYAPGTSGKWGAAVWPEIGGSRGGSENGGAMIMVLKDSPNREAAIDMLTQLTFTKEGSLATYKASGNALTPAIIDAYNDPVVAAGDSFFGNVFWKAELESMKRYVTWDFTPAAGLENTILNSYIESYLSGKMGLQEALDAAVRDMTTQIGNPLKM